MLAAQAAVITVTSTQNNPPAGQKSLFQALTEVQAGDTIAFNIPGAGPHYLVTPTDGYPLITKDNVTIDGYTQPGATPNTNPILAANNAQIKIVLDSRNGNSRLLDYAGDTPNDDTGYGDGESCILGVLGVTNVTIKGLCLIALPQVPDTEISIYGVSFAKGANGHLAGCWIGVDLDGKTGLGYGPADAVTGFRYRGRDENNTVTNTVLVSGVTIGVGQAAANPRAEFNVITGIPAIPIILEGENERISGNFLQVQPSGMADYNVGLDEAIPEGTFEGAIEIGRAGNNTLIGVDGDGVNDADERNVFGGVMPPSLRGYDHTIEFYSQTPGTNIVVAGNYIGIAVDGLKRFTNGVPPLNAGGGSARYRFGSNLDGVSDALEGNVVYNNWPAALFDPAGDDFQKEFFDELSTTGVASLRGNTLVNNFTPPVSPLKQDGEYWTNYYSRVIANPEAGLVPVVATSSSTVRLSGTVPMPTNTYPQVAVDVYLPDPEGIATGKAAGIPELPDGYIQGKTYLGTYVVDGPLDLNPAAGAFEFDISGLNLQADTPVTITANYVPAAGDPQGTETVTTLFSVPVPLKFATRPIQISSPTRSGTELTLVWSGGNPPYQVQTRSDVASGTWTNVGAATTATTATVTITGAQGYYRVQGN